MEMNTLLDAMLEHKAFDMHLLEGQAPALRLDGALVRLDSPALGSEVIRGYMETLLSEEQQAHVARGYDVSVPYRYNERLFQCHILRGSDKPAISVRIVPNDVPRLEELRYAPDVMTTLTTMIRQPRGLLLVTGETGSGKHTLCTSLLESVNVDKGTRIWTLEDPISMEMTSKQALITQRQVGRDVVSFEAGLQAAENADVNIVYVSELRSLEAVQRALALAETGHMVMAVMGVGSVSEALQRLSDVFGTQAPAIRSLLAQTLIGVVAQRLLRRAEGGRVPIVEILRNTPRVRQMLRDGVTDFTLAMEAGREQGMQTMDAAIDAALQAGHISK